MPVVHLLVGVVAVMFTTSTALAQPCSQAHPESAGERARRESGMRYLGAVNAAEARAQSERGRYAPLIELSELPSAPVGFIPKLLFDQWSYLISLKDYFDACGLALFSDERGVIYEAHPRALPSQQSPERAPEHSVASPTENGSRDELGARESSGAVRDSHGFEKCIGAHQLAPRTRFSESRTIARNCEILFVGE